MPRWLIDIYISTGIGLLVAVICAGVAIFWFWVSGGQWWGLLALLGTFLVLVLGIPTLVWLFGLVK